VLETDTLEAVWQSPGLLNQKGRGGNTSVRKFERKKKERYYCWEAVIGEEWGKRSKKTRASDLRYVVFSCTSCKSC
jgi:hypothetical protein